MCDYSLQNVKSRAAKVDDKLVTKNFGTGTTGFADVADKDTAVCVLPGTEIAFDDKIVTSFCKTLSPPGSTCDQQNLGYNVARFRQINKDKVVSHHDALELPDGRQVLLTLLKEGQTATVLQLPAAPKTEQEAEEQKRLETIG